MEKNKKSATNRKEQGIKLKRITKINPHVDEKVVGESLEIVHYLRKVGIGARGFNILGSSESRLRIKDPVMHRL